MFFLKTSILRHFLALLRNNHRQVFFCQNVLVLPNNIACCENLIFYWDTLLPTLASVIKKNCCFYETQIQTAFFLKKYSSEKVFLFLKNQLFYNKKLPKSSFFYNYFFFFSKNPFLTKVISSTNIIY